MGEPIPFNLTDAQRVAVHHLLVASNRLYNNRAGLLSQPHASCDMWRKLLYALTECDKVFPEDSEFRLDIHTPNIV